MRMSNLGGWMMGALVAAGIGCAPNVASRVDTPGGATEPVFRVAQGAVTFIGFDSPRSRLVAATPRNLTVWDLQRRRVVCEYPFGGNPLSRALVSGGRRLAAGFTVSGPGVQTYRTGLIDLESGRVTLLNPPANDYSALLATTADGTRLIRATSESAAKRVTVQMWRLSDDTLIDSTPFEPAASTSGHMAVSADGKRLAIGTHNRSRENPSPTPPVGRVLIIDLVTHRLLTSFPTADIPRAMAFTPDGTQLLMGSDADAAVHVFTIQTGLEVATFGDPGGGVNAGRGVRRTIAMIQVVAGSSLVVTGSHGDPDIHIWDASQRSLVRTITLDAPPFALAIRPGGRQLAVGTSSGSVYVRDIDDPPSPRPMP